MKPDSNLGCFILLLAVLGGFVLGGPLVNSSALPFVVRDRDVFIPAYFGCGLLIALLLVYGMRSLLHATVTVANMLQQVGKPNLYVAMALIISGAVCLVAVMWLESQLVPHLGLAQTSIEVGTPGPSFAMSGGHGSPTFTVLASQLFATLVFLAASAMIAAGIWSSLPPAKPNI